jgi:hypothetical protein
MDFDVRLAATNFTSTVVPKYLLCVWTGVISDNSCKALLLLFFKTISPPPPIYKMCGHFWGCLLYILTSSLGSRLVKWWSLWSRNHLSHKHDCSFGGTDFDMCVMDYKCVPFILLKLSANQHMTAEKAKKLFPLRFNDNAFLSFSTLTKLYKTLLFICLFTVGF